MTIEVPTVTDREAALKKLKKEIKGIRFAMMTTVDDDGTLLSRPMATHDLDPSGVFWFFTWANSEKVEEVERTHQVNLSYSEPDENRFVSVSGTAELVRDYGKAKELWKPFLKAWFPDGLEDPNLALLRVTPEKAEYWDTTNNAFMHIAGFAKALMTRKPYHPGDNEKLLLSE